MKNHEENQQFLVELTQQLADENLSQIDFDRLSAWLVEQQQEQRLTSELATELGQLRDDYLARISGLVKATAVADRRSSALADGVRLIEDLEKLSSEELISCYGKVSARFRDMFPGSPHSPLYRWMGGNKSPRRASSRINDYK